CDEASSGLAFRCGKYKFQLDVKCALLLTVESKDTDKIQHPAHDHPLVLHKSKEFGTECAIELQPEIHHPFHSLHPLTLLRDLSYQCKSKDANKILHCATKHPLVLCGSKELSDEKEIHHPFHPLHVFTLSSPLPLPHHETFQCSSCLGLDDWFLLRYRCAKCDFELHIDCSKPKLLPSLTILEEQSTEKGTVDSENEGSSAIEATIENLNDQIAKSKPKRKALKNEVKKNREILKGFEEELEQKN
ncbi:hypothetical protein Goshw_000127, partial [Gossypium schwendimanii]|nr:hypothetical protein [Gossypium schwendimanii]